MSDVAEIIGIIVIIAGLIIGLALLFTIPVWFLWNWLCPELFGLAKISIPQAFGLLVLTGLLFRSSGYSRSEK